MKQNRVTSKATFVEDIESLHAIVEESAALASAHDALTNYAMKYGESFAPALAAEIGALIGKLDERMEALVAEGAKYYRG